MAGAIAAARGDDRIVLEANTGLQRNALIGEHSVFRQQLDALQVAGSLRTGGVAIVHPARPPASPVGPTGVKIVLVALVVAVLMGLSLALLIP